MLEHTHRCGAHNQRARCKHGQDLFSIFTINDLPSEQNHYLFNGDLVDRGDFGCEVVLTVLIFKLLYPNCVHINRGNHEDRAQNETAVRMPRSAHPMRSADPSPLVTCPEQGFLAEVLRKYKGSGDAAGRGGRVYVPSVAVPVLGLGSHGTATLTTTCGLQVCLVRERV